MAAGAIAVAVGPLIGGVATTYFSWRWVFVGEVLVVLVILLLAGGSPTRRRRRAGSTWSAPSCRRSGSGWPSSGCCGPRVGLGDPEAGRAVVVGHVARPSG